MKSTQARIVPKDEWSRLLNHLDEQSEIFFVQQGSSRTDNFVVNSFVQGPFGTEIPTLLTGSISESFKLKKMSEKADLLQCADSLMKRVSPLLNKRERMLKIIEELFLTCFNLTASADTNVSIMLEWDAKEAWIHGRSMQGEYQRKHLAEDPSLMTVLSSATDLYIRVVPGRGSWFAARVDLELTNPEHDKEPKRLLVDDR